jgi:predicted HicB family RNase H-like nuclease
MMKYKGYVGKVDYDGEAEIFHGEVVGIRDVVTFQGRSVAELKKAFRESVDDYLDFCKGRGESSDKPCSGQFVLRIDSELHRQVNMLAGASGLSLNTWVADRLRKDVEREFGAKGRARGRKPRSKSSVPRKTAAT